VLVVTLGTGAAGGPPDRARSCILIESSSSRIILDFGDGCSSRLQRIGLSLSDIDLIYISHTHPDHYAGIFDAMVHDLKATPHILADESIALDVKSTLEAYLPRSFMERIKITTTRNHLFVLKNVVIKTIPVSHSIPCYGAIVEVEGSRIVYSADTRYVEPLLYEAMRSDLTIVEATMPSSMSGEAIRTGHMSVSDIYRLSSLVEQPIIVTHVTSSSERELLSANLPPRVIIAHDLTGFGV